MKNKVALSIKFDLKFWQNYYNFENKNTFIENKNTNIQTDLTLKGASKNGCYYATSAFHT